MKKRLLMMLLLLCLLLTALTATVSAYNTNVNGKNVRITDVITYFCDRCHTAQTVVDDDYTIDGIQARTPSGTTKSLAEWKHGDSLVISVSVKDTVCSVCKERLTSLLRMLDIIVINSSPPKRSRMGILIFALLLSTIFSA